MALTQAQKTAVQPQLDLLGRRMGNVVGQAAYNKMQTRTKSDPQAAVYAEGDEIFIPKSLDCLRIQNLNGTEVPVVIAPYKNGETTGAKAVYLSALNRSVPVYNDDLTPSGTIEYAKTDANHDVFDAVTACATDGEVFDAIKGKTLKVVKVKSIKAARWSNGVVTGTRTRNIPVFTFA